MLDNRNPGQRRSPPANGARNGSNRGIPGLLKLFLVALGLLVLAAYLGRSKSATGDTGPMQASTPDAGAVTKRDPVILKANGAGHSASASVGDARFSISADGRSVHIVGGIGRNFSDNLKQALATSPFLQRVVITSGGGYAGPGLEAARLIRQNNLIVKVKGYCASMCVGLWAAAAAREMEPDAVIGLHQWRANCGSLPEPERKECEYSSQFWTSHDTSYDGWLRSAGFSDRLLGLQENTPADEVAVLSAPQLWEEGVDFSVVDADGKRMDREQVQSFLSMKYGGRRSG